MDKLIEFVKQELANDFSGHNFQHITRVVNNAKKLMLVEGGDEFIILASCYLHDVVDEKLFTNQAAQLIKVDTILKAIGCNEKNINEIIEIITSISYHNGNYVSLNSLNAKIVRDADRLDALGAIGIIRTIEYGNSLHRLFYDENNLTKYCDHYEFKASTNTTLSHFYDKLLKLEDLMLTKTGKQLAKQRTEFLKLFLDQFYKELF